jgi:hypothetical protein
MSSAKTEHLKKKPPKSPRLNTERALPEWYFSSVAAYFRTYFVSAFGSLFLSVLVAFMLSLLLNTPVVGLHPNLSSSIIARARFGDSIVRK